MLIFISHSSADKPFARRLKESLQERGVTTWLDEAEIRVGDSIPERIAEGIAGADMFCIIISKASANSKWVTRELNTFMPRFIETSGTILPCRLDHAAIPTLLSDIKYADFSRSFEAGFEQLQNALRLREEIALQEPVQGVVDRFQAELSPAEKQFVLDGAFYKYRFIGAIDGVNLS